MGAGRLMVDEPHILVIEDEPSFAEALTVGLGREEFEVLTLLMQNAERVLPRDVIIDRVWGSDYHGDTKTLDAHIKRLRSKLEEDRRVSSSLRSVFIRRSLQGRWSVIRPL